MNSIADKMKMAVLGQPLIAHEAMRPMGIVDPHGGAGLPWLPGVGSPEPSKWPGAPLPPPFGDPLSPWPRRETPGESMRRERDEAEKKKALERAMIEAVKKQMQLTLQKGEMEVHFGLARKARADAEQSASFAGGVESAESALGARHFLRLALKAGHLMGLLRCWAAIAERSFQAGCLAQGKSETLMAAALGAEPASALGFLSERGFEPSVEVSSLALLTMLAAPNPQIPAIEALIGSFGAGTLNPLALADLERRKKGLGELARSRGEAFELGRISHKPELPSKPSQARL